MTHPCLAQASEHQSYILSRLTPEARKVPVSLIWLIMAALITLALPAEARDYQEIEWTDLLPDDDLQALENRPDFISDIPEGSEADLQGAAPEANLSMEESAAWQRYDAALKSTRTRPEFDGRAVKIPGFVVPLEFDEQQNVSEFFLVPFFGACIHVPPPPPNQIIHAKLAAPYQLESIYEPVWLTGTLQLQETSNEMGASAYSIDVDSIRLYYD